MAQKNALAERLQERHPLYQAFVGDWEFYADSYEGGDAYMRKQYLFRHLRETDNDYKERKARAVFTNLVRKQIDIYASFIFREEIKRDAKDLAFEDFKNNADRRGTPLSQIMSDQVGKLSMISGHAVTIVDLPKDARKSRTRLDDRRLGIQPYVTTYEPSDVVDWALDIDGRYSWIRVKEAAPDTSEPFSSRMQPRTIYRTWTKGEWFVHNDEGVLLDQGEHGLGEVPAVLTTAKEHLRYFDIGESLMVDTAVLNRSIFNYQSLLDEFLYRQCFNILAIPVEDKLPNDRRKNVASELGTNKGIRYPAGSSPPSYISPPSDPADVIMRRITDAQRELVEVAKLQDRNGSDAQKSGIAHAYEFHESNSAFAKIAKNLEDGERKIIRLVYLWQGVKDAPVTVSYPSDFNVTTLGDTIEQALGLLQVNVSPTFNGMVRKRIANETFPEMDAATKKAIEQEVGATPSPDAVELEIQRRLAEMREEDDHEEMPPEEEPMKPKKKP
jgi:hypothetical protein